MPSVPFEREPIGRAMGVGNGPAGGFVLQPKYGGAKKAVKKISSTPGKAGKSKEK